MAERKLRPPGVLRKVFCISSELSPKRNLVMDYIRGIVMLMVLYQHAFAPMNEYVTQFHMAALFVLSGFTEFYVQKKTTFGAYLKSRFMRIIVPYFCFEILYLLVYFPFQLWRGLPFAPARQIVSSILTATINPYYIGFCGRLWFLPTMFCSSVFAYVVRTYIIRNRGVWLNCICIAVLTCLSYGTKYIPQRLPFTVDISFLTTAWLLLGFTAGEFLKWLLDEKHHIWDLTIGLLSLAALAACNLLADPKCMIYANRYEDYPFMFMAALSGTVLTFLVGKWLCAVFGKIKPIHNFIIWYSINSLAVYVVHSGIRSIFTEVLRDRTWYFMLVAMLFGTIPAVNIVRNYMPFMLGNFKKRTG